MKHIKYIVTFAISLTLCLIIFLGDWNYRYILLMPYIATNVVLPFYVIDSGVTTHKWQALFFILVPFSSFLWIFVDGIPSTISYNFLLQRQMEWPVIICCYFIGLCLCLLMTQDKWDDFLSLRFTLTRFSLRFNIKGISYFISMLLWPVWLIFKILKGIFRW